MRITILIVGLYFAASAAGAAEQVRDRELRRWAASTWASLKEMAPAAGSRLVSDGLEFDGKQFRLRPYTSPSNIGTYMSSLVCAEALGFISREEALQTIERQLKALDGVRKDFGLYFNWYETATGAVAAPWPEHKKKKFVSFVDLAWLEAGLRLAAARYPECRERARRLYEAFSYSVFFEPRLKVYSIGYYRPWKKGEPDGERSMHSSHYQNLVTEARLGVYLAVARGEPEGETAYRNMTRKRTQIPGAGARQTLRSWGGSMFEGLLVPVFVAEEEWSKKSWAVANPRYAAEQVRFAKETLNVRYWGFSPASSPDGKYREFGVRTLAEEKSGYPSGVTKNGKLHVVVSPYAAFLASRYLPEEAFSNLRLLDLRFSCFSEKHGFADSVDLQDGTKSPAVLSFDQSIILAVLTNHLCGDVLRTLFAGSPGMAKVRRLLSEDDFGLPSR